MSRANMWGTIAAWYDDHAAEHTMPHGIAHRTGCFNANRGQAAAQAPTEATRRSEGVLTVLKPWEMLGLRPVLEGLCRMLP